MRIRIFIFMLILVHTYCRTRTRNGYQNSHIQYFELCLSSGARDRNDPVLTKIGQLRTFETQLAKHNGEMQGVSQRLAQLKLRIDRFVRLLVRVY